MALQGLRGPRTIAGSYGRGSTMARRTLTTALVLILLAAAGCTSGSGGGTPGRPTGSAPSAGPPTAGPPAWRVAESVPLGLGSVLHDVAAVDATHTWAVGGGGLTRKDTNGGPVIERWD